jgi:hypothetical protein
LEVLAVVDARTVDASGSTATRRPRSSANTTNASAYTAIAEYTSTTELVARVSITRQA